MLTLGSLFDGIGTWQLSARHNGIKPLWSCEIDPYPSAVSHYHFPETKQYGDIKEIRRVRKLTVIECERLMGLPDNWTNIEFNGKPASDSRKYKAIGNGMAVPCSDFVLSRIKEEIECQQ